MAVKTPIALLLALAGASCGLLKPPEYLDHDARQFMKYLRTDRLESARAMVEIKNLPLDTLDKYLAIVHDFIQPFPADSFTLVGWNVMFFAGRDTTGQLTYEARGDGRTALFYFAVARLGGLPAEITAFRWEETAKPLAVANAFTFSGKTPTHYLYLALAILAVLTCVAGATFAGVQRLGLPWILASLVGVGSFSINWTTGATQFNPMSIHVLGAGYVRPGFVGPWVLTWSIPAGAILMLIVWQRKRRRLTALATPGSPSPA